MGFVSWQPKEIILSLCILMPWGRGEKKRDPYNLWFCTFSERRWLFGNRQGERRVSMGSWRQIIDLSEASQRHNLLCFSFLGLSRGGCGLRISSVEAEDCLAGDEFSNLLYSFQSEKPFLLLLRKFIYLPIFFSNSLSCETELSQKLYSQVQNPTCNLQLLLERE